MERFEGEKIELSEKEWKERLNPEKFHVLRKRGTEPPFKNAYYALHEKGIYVCGGCGLPLFNSMSKYDSGTGWPSFWEPIFRENISFETDVSLGSERIEVVCSRCGGHLGHVFGDGPPPTGKRYCMNSAALEFINNHKEQNG